MEENPDNIAPNDADDSLSFFESELEALQSIYINEIEVKQEDDQKSICVSIDLHPATADKPEEQYVKMTLKFTLSEEYPHTIPEISIHNPRGLSDEKINSIRQDLISVAEKKIGNSMLFEIIEAAKEHLTAGNRPYGECAICLHGFNEVDVFTKTDCYHYFHSHCLAQYAKNATAFEVKDKDSNTDDTASNTELLCPMCRVPIQFSGSEELFPPPSAGDDEYQISEQILEMQKKMADLYQMQLEKGGIIDVDAEKNKYLLEISDVPTRPNAPDEDVSHSAHGETDENPDSASSSPQKDRVQHTKAGHKEANTTKESNSVTVRSEEKSKDTKYGKKFNRRGNYNPHFNNFPRNSRKQKNYSDSYAEDLEDEDSYKSDNWDVTDETQMDAEGGVHQSRDPSDSKNNTDAYPGSRSSKFSPNGKDGQRPSSYNRPRRGNQEGFSRGNYFRNPSANRTNTRRGYASNTHQRYNYRERMDQSDRRVDSAKDSSLQIDSHNTENSPDSLPEGERDSQSNKNVPNLNKKYDDKSNYRGKNQFRGRYPGNSFRGRGGNFPRKPNFRGNNYGRNWQEENYDSRREKGSHFNNNYSNDLEKDSSQDASVSSEAALFGEAEAQIHREVNVEERDSRNNPGRHSRGNSQRDSGLPLHEGNSEMQGEVGDSYETDNTGDNTTSYKNRSPKDQGTSLHWETKETSRRNGSQEAESRRSGNRYAHDFSQGHDERRYSSKRNDNSRGHLVRDQFPSGKNSDYEENGRHYQRNEHYSQNSAQRKSTYRDSYGGNPQPHMDRRGYQHGQNDYRGGRGRNNSNYQNRTTNFDGGQRRNRYDQDKPGFRNERNSYRFNDADTRKFEDRYSNASQNGKFSESFNNDQAHSKVSSDVCVGEVNGVKSLESLSVKAFVPKEDSSGLNCDEAPCKEPYAVNLESNLQKMPYPPPGFSNPLKKVVYGLEAAKPPPGFPRR